MRNAASKRSKSPEYIANQSKGQKNSISIEVNDVKTNTITTYHAIRAAARALGIDKRYIENYIYLKFLLRYIISINIKYINKKKKPTVD